MGNSPSSLPPSSTNQPATSLFGSSATSQQQNQPTQTSSLFGTTQPNQQSGGLFSTSDKSGNNEQQASSSLFGGAQSTQGVGGGLFGSQQNQQTSGGPFSSSNAQQSQPQPTGGLFDSLGQSQTQPQQTQSSLFGGFNTQNKTSSLFGNTQAQTQNQSNAMQQPSTTSLFSSRIGQLTQQQQTVPGVKISVNELRSTTRFNDLHEELQKSIESVDNFILAQIHKQEECLAATDAIDVIAQQLPPDVEYCTKMLDIMQHALEDDAESIALAKGLVKIDAADAKLSFRNIQTLKVPQQLQYGALWHPGAMAHSSVPSFSDGDMQDGASRSIVDYFTRRVEEMTKYVDRYKGNIAEVESYLRGVETNTMHQMQQFMFTRTQEGGERSTEDQVRELAAVLREFENGILGVAAKVGGAREKVQGAMLGPIDQPRDFKGTRFMTS